MVELFVPIALHATSDERAVKSVESNQQRRPAIALVVVNPGAATDEIQQKPGLAVVEGLDLALFVDRQHHCLHRSINMRATSLSTKWARRDHLNVRTRYCCRSGREQPAPV